MGWEEEDTFPGQYLMNNRGTLRSLFRGGGFDELGFRKIDDLSVFGQFKFMNYLELSLWGCLRGGWESVSYP